VMGGEIPGVLRGRRLVVVDLEGNGQHPPDIVEIAVLPVGDTSADTVSREDVRSWLVRPPRPIAPIVTRSLHGISDTDVANCPAWPEVAGEIGEVLAGRVLVAHHAATERRVLAAHLPDWAPPVVLDTLRLARRRWPGRTHCGGYSLNTLVAHAGVGTSDLPDGGGWRPHRAAYDTWCTWRLLCALTAEAGLDWTRLLSVAGLPGPLVRARTDRGLW
jgi:DNA polymerase III epsilon subunit-like protein